MTTALTTVEADTKLFMESFLQILDKEESDDDAPAPKKQKASSSDQLTIAEALDITFSAFDYYIRQYYDGDISDIDGAKENYLIIVARPTPLALPSRTNAFPSGPLRSMTMGRDWEDLIIFLLRKVKEEA